jgi:hypothetical protein
MNHEFQIASRHEITEHSFNMGVTDEWVESRGMDIPKSTPAKPFRFADDDFASRHQLFTLFMLYF